MYIWFLLETECFMVVFLLDPERDLDIDSAPVIFDAKNQNQDKNQNQSFPRLGVSGHPFSQFPTWNQFQPLPSASLSQVKAQPWAHLKAAKAAP